MLFGSGVFAHMDEYHTVPVQACDKRLCDQKHANDCAIGKKQADARMLLESLSAQLTWPMPLHDRKIQTLCCEAMPDGARVDGSRSVRPWMIHLACCRGPKLS